MAKPASSLKNGAKRQGFFAKHLPLYALMLPGLVYLVINNYMPMFGLTFAFKKINYNVGVFNSPWCGLNNFSFLFKTDDAFIIFRNTICYNLVFIILGNVVAIIIAILLEQIRTKALKLYQTCILIPYLLSITVVSYLAFAFLSSDSGFINNSILEPLGIEPISWYSTPRYWPFILVFINLWKGFGYSSILYPHWHRRLLL